MPPLDIHPQPSTSFGYLLPSQLALSLSALLGGLWLFTVCFGDLAVFLGAIPFRVISKKTWRHVSVMAEGDSYGNGNHIPFSHGLSLPAPVPARTIKIPDHPEALSFQIRGAAPPCVFAVGRGELEPGVQREPLGAALCAWGDMCLALVYPSTSCSSGDLQRPVCRRRGGTIGRHGNCWD